MPAGHSPTPARYPKADGHKSASAQVDGGIPWTVRRFCITVGCYTRCYITIFRRPN
ncbi:hypothetical protein FRAHR75_280016 [Frankia sp. Hr75.2]|nr:hypothetical protein FRAHR75_280016 [Frankia sp. Hr75.2]